MTRRRGQSGTILLSVMLLIALASMVSASLLFRMAAAAAAAANSDRGEQAYAAAMSGVQRALGVLRDGAVGRVDNPEVFRNQLVAADGADRWYFTVYADNEGDDEQVRYGLMDEAAKISLNAAPAAVIEALLGGEAQLVDSLLDYRDRDDEPRPEGAEQDYYDLLPQPYLIKNGPLGTVEELLLVKGFTGAIVYGEDANHNGLLDPNEDDGDKTFPPDDADGVLNRGLRALATTLAYEPNVDNQAQPRVDLNKAGAAELAEAGLDSQTVGLILLYRGDGNKFTHPSQLLEMRYQPKSSGGTARGPGRRGRRPSPRTAVELRSGVDGSRLDTVLDRLTATSADRLLGLVNVNTASAKVLALLPGLDEALAARIVEARAGLAAEDRATPAWLYTQGLLDAEAFKSAAPLLTARGFQHRLRCVGFGRSCGRYRIVEAVLDLAGKTPRISYLRDITRLGLPFALDPDVEEH